MPGGSDGKASAYSAGDSGSIPGSERSPGEGNGNPLQYSCPTPFSWPSVSPVHPQECAAPKGPQLAAPTCTGVARTAGPPPHTHTGPAGPTQSPQHPYILSFLQSRLLLEWLLSSPKHLGQWVEQDTSGKGHMKGDRFFPCLRGNKSHNDVQFRFCCRAELSLTTPPPPHPNALG